MLLAHRISHGLGEALRARGTERALARLDDRRLADIGLAREDARLAARLAARSGGADVPLGELVRQVREAREAVPAAPGPLPRLSREEVAGHVAEGRRLREQEIDRLLREAGGAMAWFVDGLTAPLAALIDATGVPGRVELALARRREYRRVRAELAAYSERELMADLRLVPAEIGDVAAEAADIRVGELVRARGRRGRAPWGGTGRPAVASATGRARA